MGRREVQWIIGLTALAALIRFSTLGARSYWLDEAAVVDLVRRSFGGMLHQLRTGNESTPPLYYALAWAWVRVFGTGEAGLRALSALAGTATVPVAYLAAREIVSRRAAIVTAVLVALSPVLVWHSQDARAYALAVLLGALSFLLFIRAAREPTPRALALWALSAALALATHYFSLLLVVPEAAWLLLAGPRPSRPAVAVGAVVVAAAGLAPLLLTQYVPRGELWLEDVSLGARLIRAPAEYLVGYQPPWQRTSAVAAAVLVAAAAMLVPMRGARLERRGVVVAATVGASAFVLLLVPALAGVDYFLTRYLVVAWIPVAVVMAAGFGSSRWGLAALACLCGVFVVIDVVGAEQPKFERDDWRGAARALGPPTTARAIVLTPTKGARPLRLYRPRAGPMSSAGATVAELDVLALGPPLRRPGHRPKPPRADHITPPSGFRLAARRHARYFTLVRFRADPPVRVVPDALRPLALGHPGAAILLERPARSGMSGFRSACLQGRRDCRAGGRSAW